MVWSRVKKTLNGLSGQTSMQDQPNSRIRLHYSSPRKSLREIWGLTTFQTWFVVQDKHSGEIYFLNWIRWSLNWACNVFYNSQEPNKSIIEIQGGGTNTGGIGLGAINLPILSGEVAEPNSQTCMDESPIP